MDKTLKDKLLTSEIGKELFSWITGIYDNCKIMIEIYQALGIEFDKIDFMLEDTARQMFPQTATWGLDIWEQRLKLPTNKAESNEERRGKIIAKLQSKVIINPETMAQITKSFSGADVQIKEWIEEYTFGVLADVEYISAAEKINKIIKRIKPSHMAFIVMFTLLEKQTFYVGAVTTIGVVQTMLPYDLDDINISANINLFGATTHIQEKVLLRQEG